MASDIVYQSAVATTGGTLTGANYLEDKVNIISPDSLLDFHVFITSIGGLSIRDIIFCITALITIRAALRIKKIKLEELAKLKSDKEKVSKDD
jgi:uncharacterized membrane-anchored protein YitT (DUF2179 family)